MEQLMGTLHSSVLILFMVFVGPAFATCPLDANKEAMKCLAGLGTGDSLSGLSPGSFVAPQHAEKAVYACGNGDFLDAVNCVERVMESCKDVKTDSAHFLRSMIDIEKTREAITFFCTHVQDFAKDAPCIVKHQQNQAACASDALNSFMTQSRSTSNMDSLMRFQCRFYVKALACTEEVLTEKCSSELAYIVTTLMDGLEPPVCLDMGKEGVKEGYNIGNAVEENTNRNIARAVGAQIMITSLCLYVSLLRIGF